MPELIVSELILNDIAEMLAVHRLQDVPDGKAVVAFAHNHGSETVTGDEANIDMDCEETVDS